MFPPQLGGVFFEKKGFGTPSLMQKSTHFPNGGVQNHWCLCQHDH